MRYRDERNCEAYSLHLASLLLVSLLFGAAAIFQNGWREAAVRTVSASDIDEMHDSVRDVREGWLLALLLHSSSLFHHIIPSGLTTLADYV